MRNIIGMTIVGGVLLTAACSSSTGPTGPVPTTEVVAVDSIELAPQLVRLATVGDSRRLIVWVHPIEATDHSVTWESSNPAVASVDASGLVTAVTQGPEVTITATATDGGHQATARVRVGTPPLIVGGTTLPAVAQ